MKPTFTWRLTIALHSYVANQECVDGDEKNEPLMPRRMSHCKNPLRSCHHVSHRGIMSSSSSTNYVPGEDILIPFMFFLDLGVLSAKLLIIHILRSYTPNKNMKDLMRELKIAHIQDGFGVGN